VSTFNELTDATMLYLYGFTTLQDQVTHLTSAVTASASVMPIADATAISRGILEIDDELIWVDSFDKANNTLNVIPGFGRGYQGTTASPHAQYAPVTLSPTFPRSSIKKAINDTINSFYPKLWIINSYTFTFNASQVTYPLPDDVEGVLFISWQTTGSSQEWLPVNRWRLDGMANAATFNTNNTLNIYENVQPGRTIQVWYTATPNTLDANTDDFADVSGLPDSCKDVVVLGAAYKLLSYLDAGRINLCSAEADLNDSKLPSSAGAAASRYIFALYQQRLNEEALKLADKYPIRIHYTR